MRINATLDIVAVGFCFVLAACGGDQTPEADADNPASESVSPPAGEPAAPFTGAFDVNGRELNLVCTGQGSPTIVLEPGEGGTSSTLDVIRTAYDKDTMVCGYDRANLGSSGAAPVPRKGDDVAADLYGLLGAAEVPGPYVLVGQSAGGLLVQAFAAQYPDEVVGVVALNPVPPWQAWSTQGFAKMTAAERQEETSYYQGSNGESFDYRDISATTAVAKAPDAAFHVLISTVAQCDSPKDICGRTYPAYTQIMKSLADSWPNGRFSEVSASHDIAYENPKAVQKVIDDVLARAK